MGGRGSLWGRRPAFHFPRRARAVRMAEEGEVKTGARVDEGEARLAEIAEALRAVVRELKEVNTSLKAIARSQAQRATQKRPSNP